MKQLLILKNGLPPSEIRPFYGFFEDQILRSMGLTRHDALILDMTTSPSLPRWDRISGIVISGSLSNVTLHEPWMEEEAAWVREAVNAEVPLLGICFGHQMLAWALGGEVADNPHGPEMGTVAIHLTKRAQEDFLFMGMPSPLAVPSAHGQSVVRLPQNAVLLAGNEHDGSHAFRIGECAWGLQFHPEYDAAVTRMLIAANRDALLEKGQDPTALQSRCRETPQAADIMKRFALLTRPDSRN
jgi:GMP synthase (glutamine-hydrolysing)